MVIQGSLAAIKADVRALRLEMATKVELETLRQEVKILDDKFTRLAMDFVNFREEVRETRSRMATKDDISLILNAIDAFAGKTEAAERGRVLHGQAITEMRVELKGHDQRLAALESRLPS